MKNAFKKHKTIILALFILALVSSIGAGFWYFYPKPSVKTEQKPPTVEQKPACESFDKQKVLISINNIRQTTLEEDLRLSQIAQERAIQMNGEVDNHKGFYDRFNNSPLPYGYVHFGENLTKYVCKNQGVIESWLNSPPHKATMENERYDTIGIAEYKNVVVTEFGDY